MPKSNNQKKAEAEAAGRPPKKTKQQENAGKSKTQVNDNILISQKKQKNKIIIMEYFDFTRFFLFNFRKRKSRKLPRLRKTRRNPSTIRNCMSTTAYSTKRVDYYSFFCMFHPHTLKEVDHFSFLKNPHHAQNSKFKMFLEEE